MGRMDALDILSGLKAGEDVNYPLRSLQIMVAMKVNYCYLHGVVRGVEVGRPRHRAYRA